MREEIARVIVSGDEVEKLDQLPAGPLAARLLKFIGRTEPAVKWPAIEALGRAVARLAAEEMEAAREIIRRLLWSLNDESGAVGWGAAEALAETLARNPQLAEEYGPLLLSLLRQEPTIPEFEPLKAGAIWAVGRLALSRPDLAAHTAADLRPYLSSPEPNLRGLAAWAAGNFKAASLLPDLARLADDKALVAIQLPQGPFFGLVGDLARVASQIIEGEA